METRNTGLYLDITTQTLIETSTPHHYAQPDTKPKFRFANPRHEQFVMPPIPTLIIRDQNGHII